MAPALTKLTKDRHRIHLPSHLSSSNMEADGAILSPELDPRVKLMEDTFSQKVWLNLSSLPFLDTCCSKGALEFPNSILAPLLQASTSQYKSVLLSQSLLSLMSRNKNLKESQAPALPGTQDLYFVPLPEHGGQDVVMQPEQGGAEGPDVPQSPPHYQGNTMCQYSSAVLTPTMSTEGKPGIVPIPSPSPSWPTRAPDQPVNAAAVQGTVKDQTQGHISRQAALLLRAERIQRRLQALLGDHTSRHCSTQLDALKNRLRQERTGTLPAPVDPKPDPFLAHGSIPTLGSRVPWPLKSESSLPPSTSTEIQEFACHAQALLRGVQQAIDSEATDSSSDEELLEPEQTSRTQALPFPPSVWCGCERRWQEGRAELGSRWTWLQLRVDQLEGRIQQLGDLHRQISSAKGGVVLADSQPLTDRQIQQTLLTETAGLSFTAGGHGDLASDTEPSSPTRLLRNIERQSAQLSQIVNSLMPPLILSPSSSPVSKDACRWNRLNKKAFGSLKKGEDLFSQRGVKRRRGALRRRLLQAEASCVSARTRPLVTYHKPRLFTLNKPSAHTQQELDPNSHYPASSCSACESCDPLALCSDPTCSSYSPPAGRGHSRAHPVLSLSSDTPFQQHLQRALLREDWVQRPLLPQTEPSGPSARERRLSSTPLCSSSRRHKHHGRHPGGRVRGVSPVRWAGPSQMPRRKACRGSRKRRHTHRMLEDEEDLPCWLSDHEDSSWEGLEEIPAPQASHTRKPPVQAPVRRRQGESVYNIDNIVIPMSLSAATKVEKLQYKDIITPSWRTVSSLLLEESEGDTEEKKEEKEEVELLCDEIFSRRHLRCEQREKLRWVSWGKSRRHRRTTRSGSRSLDGSTGTGGSAWERGLQSDGTPDWGCTYPDTDAEDGAEEEPVPQAPWEQRAFPLGSTEVQALLWEDEEQAEEGKRAEAGLHWERAGMDSSGAEDTSTTSSSLLSSPLLPSSLSCATLLSAGHLGNSPLENEG